ncbi:MAG: HEAT repeat domain-containing protein, partial [Polyangiales bacterium]
MSSRRKPTRSAAVAVAALALAIAGAPSAARAALWPDVPDRLKIELSSPDVQRRRAAAADLANLPKDEALPLLKKAVTDEDVDVRLVAASVAARRGISEVTDAILPWLTDAEPRLREGACDFFGALPQTKVVKVLARALGDSVATVRLAAVRALGASASSDAVAPLLARLDDSNSKIRLAVARALARLGDVRAVTPLVSKVQDEASEVRQAVVRALGELGDVRAAPALVIALSDQALEVRIEALAALGRMRAAEGVPSIAPLTVEKKAGSLEVRRAALAALGRIGNTPAIDAIIRAFGANEDGSAGTGSSPAREAAITAGAAAGPVLLARLRDSTLGPTAATAIAAGSGSTPINVASSAAWVLGELRTEGAGDVIVKAMRRGEVPPAIALHALASLGDPAQLPICLEHVASSEKAVRSEALVAAARLLDPEQPDGRAVEPLLASLELAQTPDDRAEIATLLGRTGAPRAATELAGLVASKDAALRLAAIDALGALGGASA